MYRLRDARCYAALSFLLPTIGLAEFAEGIPKGDVRAANVLAKQSSRRNPELFLRSFFKAITNPRISQEASGSEVLNSTREKLAEQTLPPDSVFGDPDFRTNYARLINRAVRRRVTGMGTRESRAGEFPACVALGAGEVGSPDEFFCTGTLIAKNIVLTAAHCSPDQPDRVFIGEKTRRGGKRIKIKGPPILFGFNEETYQNDIAVFVLEEDATVTPAMVAPPEAYNTMTYVRVVGFGYTKTKERVDTKRLTDVPIASRDGSRPRDRQYGCHPPLEFVAADPHRERDTCKGDSGGPAFTLFDGKWMLVGVTSRSTSSTGRCGDGGIYTRVDKYVEKIRETIRQQGGSGDPGVSRR